MRIVELTGNFQLADYESWAYLASEVRNLRAEAQRLVPELAGRRVWMINSTSVGGGVAEMLPKLISILRELGIDVRWGVIESDEPRFFAITKHIHNLIHGVGEPDLSDDDRELFEKVNRENASELEHYLLPGDIVVVHDPQPAALGSILRGGDKRIPFIWRCHIGLDRKTPATSCAWSFLRNYITAADHAVFSAPDYIPDFLRGKTSIIHPAIDPLSPKNRDFSPRKLQGILCNAGLATEIAPVLHPPYEHPALRLAPDGSWLPANANGEEIGLLFRPIVTQISRWDRLKGWAPLLEAFVLLKQRALQRSFPDLHRRRLEIMRLVLAGPDPGSVSDDPEGKEVLEDLVRRCLALSPELQRDIALLTLPMVSPAENAYMVNAIQRCSTVVVQNSIEEGFGLTVTEAMWKRVAVLGSSATGIRHQIRQGVDGVRISDPNNHEELADALGELLSDANRRAHFAGNAQQRVYNDFLVFAQVRGWLRTLVSVARANGARG